MLVLPKNHLNCFKDNVFECFLKYDKLFFLIFSKYIMVKNLRPEEQNII